MGTELDLTITDRAREKLQAALEEEGLTSHAIRVTVERLSEIRVRYLLDFAAQADKSDQDTEISAGAVTVWVDAGSGELLDGATIDFVDGPSGSGFKFNNPNVPENGWMHPVASKFQDLLDLDVNPNIASHGGRIELLDFRDGVAYVRMGGGCQGCGMASVTLRQGLEAAVRERIPEVTEIIDTTDHAGGSNPYYEQGNSSE